MAITESTALTGTIDPPSNLQSAPVYLYSGTEDSVVVPGVVRKLAEYYSSFNADLLTVFNISSEHAIVTDTYGNACNYLGSPYINNCGYDTASALLGFLLGPLQPRAVGVPENVRGCGGGGVLRPLLLPAPGW